MRWYSGPVLLLSLAAACATAPSPSPAAAGVPTILTVRQVPRTVGDFRRTDVHRFPQAELGVAYRYSNGSPARIDVYVYPAGREEKAADPAARAQAEARELPSALRVQQDRGAIQSFRIASDSVLTLAVPGGRLRGSHVSASLVAAGRTLESHQHIFVLGEQFVKVRASFPPGLLSLGELESFVTSLLSAMTQLPESPVVLR